MYSSASYMYITLGRWLHPCTRQKQTRFQKYTIIRYYIFLILSVFWQRSVLYWDMKRKLRFYNMSFKSRWLMRDISDGWNIRNSRWWCAALWCKPWCWAFLLFLLLSWNLTFTCISFYYLTHFEQLNRKVHKNRNIWNEVYFHILQHYEKKWQLMRDQIVMECTIATL